MPDAPRIGLVVSALERGGVESFVLRLGRGLLAEGFDVEVVTTTRQGEWFDRAAGLGLPARHLGHGPDRLALAPVVRSLQVARTLARLDYDVLLLNHAPFAQAALALLPDRTVVVPVIHNDVEWVYRTGLSNPRRWNAAVAVAPRLVAAVRARVPGRPVLEIPYGVEVPADGQAASVVVAAPGTGAPPGVEPVPGHPLRLVFVGRLVDSQKGVLRLPAILRGCLERGIDAALLVVGDGPDDAALREEFARLGLEGRTRFLRGAGPEEVRGAMLESEILLLPSNHEGLPIVLLEAQACGCVPVASRLPGITDRAVVDGTTGLLVDRERPEAFVEAVAMLHRERERWRAMRAAGRERVEAEFSAERMTRAYVDLVNQGLAGRYPLPRPRRAGWPLDLGPFRWSEYLPPAARALGRRGVAALGRVRPWE